MTWIESFPIIYYLGRFHPIFVHLPIGFITFWLGLEILELFKKYDFRSAKSLLILLTVISSIISSLLGYFLSLKGDYDQELLEEHKWGGIWLSVLLAIILIGYKYLSQIRFYKPVYYVSLSGVLALLIHTGHHGGSLTHGSDFLSSSNFEAKVSVKKAEITDINQALVYNDLVQPIFDQKCISCHNMSKKKGELLLDSYEHSMEGGKSKKTIVAGNSSGSKLIKLINLDPNEKHAMPPKGEVPLTNEEKALLAWWIETGALKDKKVAELKPDPAMSLILAQFANGGQAGSNLQTRLPQASVLDEKVRIEIMNLGINVINVAQNENMLDVRCIINKSGWNDEKTKALIKIKEQTYILDLSGTSITNKSLLVIGQLKALNTLFLQNTALTDENIQALEELENLQYLNLYNTQISDKSIPAISKLKNLKKIYLWQTKMSNKDIEQLQKNLPDTEVVGADIDNNHKKL
jgi:uncharacterized membrane protein